MYKNKVVIITGAGAGIGKAISTLLSDNGAQIAICDKDPTTLESVKVEIKNKGGNVFSSVIDVSDDKEVNTFIEEVCEHYGKIDYLFANAGVLVIGEVKDISIEHWHKVIDVNLNGLFYSVSAVYKKMIEQGFGHIVTIGSIQGLVPFPGNSSYVASKHAITGFTKALWFEACQYGIDVTLVCPGVVLTDLLFDSEYVNVDREKNIKTHKSTFDRIGLTAESCGELIIKGVYKKKLVIVISSFSKMILFFYKLSPLFVLKSLRKKYLGQER